MSRRELVVHDAGAVGGDEFLVDAAALQFVADVLAHEPVGHEEDAARGEPGDDVVNVARGDADVGLGLHVGRAVDVADDGGIGVERP
jgi:hypothetical protein